MTAAAVPAGARVCKACGKVKPLDCFALVSPGRGRARFRRGRCKPCYKRWDAARPHRQRRRKRPAHQTPEYRVAYRQTEMGRLVRQRADARRKLKHWTSKVGELTRQIRELNAR